MQDRCPIPVIGQPGDCTPIMWQIAIFTVYKQVFLYLNFTNHRKKESLASTANKPLVGTVMTIGDVMVSITIGQTRSQGLSSLPPLVIGRKTLVAAGHVTTQNLGGKKICRVGGVAEYFLCYCDKLCGFQIL